jgi:cytochrome c oxidase assembly protein subunit 11
MDEKRTVSKYFWLKLLMVPIGMFGFAFALIPLYDVLCDVTGLNGQLGNSQVDYSKVVNYAVDENRHVTVDFTSAISTGFPINFYPKTKKMEVIPGKMYTVEYIAENRSNEVIVGQAVPSIAPGVAALHFKKLECFCFSKQVFQPKKPVVMAVRFVIEPDLDKSIHNITLSYNFFKIDESKT